MGGGVEDVVRGCAEEVGLVGGNGKNCTCFIAMKRQVATSSAIRSTIAYQKTDSVSIRRMYVGFFA